MRLNTCKCKALALDIYIGGNLADAQRACREFCKVGLCVTIEPVEFIYTGGQESGVRVGLKSYPRFPKENSQLWHEADALARQLIETLCQTSAMICGPNEHVWITEKQPA